MTDPCFAVSLMKATDCVALALKMAAPCISLHSLLFWKSQVECVRCATFHRRRTDRVSAVLLDDKTSFQGQQKHPFWCTLLIIYLLMSKDCLYYFRTRVVGLPFA